MDYYRNNKMLKKIFGLPTVIKNSTLKGLIFLRRYLIKSSCCFFSDQRGSILAILEGEAYSLNFLYDVLSRS